MKPILLTIVASTILVAAAPSIPHPAATPATGWQEPDGRLLYLKNCRQCHGATGEPSPKEKRKYPKIKTLSDPAFLAQRSDDSLVKVMTKGAGRDMKSFSDKLTPAEMLAVAKYVRTLGKSER